MGKKGKNVCLCLKMIDVLFELTFPIGRLVLMNDSFRREAVKVSFHVVEQLLSGILLFYRFEPLDFRADSALL